MSYQVHNFQTGDVIEAAPINEMDAQIQLNEQNITSKLNADQGSNNAGKFIKVGNDGMLTPDNVDMSAKADKVVGGTTGNFVSLDANGNILDSGHKHSDYIESSKKGVANGVAELDNNGKIPSSQLPGYVDDIIEGYYYNNKFYEEESHTTEITPETGKIYVDLSTNKAYRWGGSSYVEISESLALGETSSTAYRGDRGKIAYDHASAKGSAFASGLYKITTNSEGHVTAAAAVQKSDITGLGVGTVTGITMNNSAVPIDENGSADLGTVITAHQDISGKIDYPSTPGTSGQVLTSDGNGGQSWQTPSGGTVTDVQEDGTSILSSGIANILTMTGAGSSADGTKGLVPAPAAGDNEKFLKGNGTWDDVPDPQTMTGATASTAGAGGLVPAPSAGDQNKVLRGDGTWYDIPAVDDMTGASSNDGGTHGLVPAPAAGDNVKFLKGDGTWDNVPDPQVMTGAGASSSGTSGLVPAPEAGENNKYLKGDGTWSDIPSSEDMVGAGPSASGSHGLVPAPYAGDNIKFLRGDGTWASVSASEDMTGATASESGTHGLVPAPSAGDEGKVLQGNGTWQDIPTEVQEYASATGTGGFPVTGSSGVIYIAKDTNIIYRWDDTLLEYVPISSSGGGSSSLHKIAFNILTTDWFAITGGFGARVTSSYIISSSEEFVIYDNSISTNLNGNINTSKDGSSHYIQFETTVLPSGTISGIIYSLSNQDGSVAVELIEGVLSIKDGGTDASNASDARINLGLGTAATNNVSNDLTETESGKVLDARQGKALDDKITAINSSKGTANGIATLDSSGKVPSNQLPSYVDDVVEGYLYNGAFYSDEQHQNLITAETGKIYVDLTSNKSYRYGGSAYTSIDSYAVATQSDAGLMSASDKTKLDNIAQSMLINIDFSIQTSDWTLSNGVYTYELTTAYVTATSKEIVQYDSSLRTYGQYDIDAVKKTGGGGMIFSTLILPTGTISGSLYVFANENGNVAVIVGEAVKQSALRDVPFTILVSDWVLDDDIYVCEYLNSNITNTSKDIITYDSSYRSSAKADINVEKKSGGGGLVFTTSVIPTGSISGNAYSFDNIDGKLPILVSDTVTPIDGGGTGQNTLSGVKSAFGITSLESQVSSLSDHLAQITTQTITNFTVTDQPGNPVGIQFDPIQGKIPIFAIVVPSSSTGLGEYCPFIIGSPTYRTADNTWIIRMHGGGSCSITGTLYIGWMKIS